MSLPARIVIVGLLLTVTTNGGQAIAQKSQPWQIVALETSGQRIRGRFQSLTTDVLQMQNVSHSAANKSQTKTITAKSLVSIQFGNQLKDENQQPLLFLNSGDRIAGKIRRIEDDSVSCELSFSKTVNIPLESTRAIVFKRPNAPGATRNLLHELDRYVAKNDTVWLENGDRLRGEFVELSDNQLKLETDNGEISLERNRVLAVAFNVELLSPYSAPARFVRASLTDGSDWTLVRVIAKSRGQQSSSGQSATENAADVSVTAQTLFGEEITMPVSQVCSLQFRNPNVVDLTDLEPAQIQYSPFFTAVDGMPAAAHFVKNRSVTGGMLEVSGRRFSRGLGMRSKCSVSYRLANQYARLLTSHGMDDSAAQKGSAVFTISVDGDQRYRSEVSSRSQLVDVPSVDLKSARELTLTVDFATHGDILDHADWCEPVLIRE